MVPDSNTLRGVMGGVGGRMIQAVERVRGAAAICLLCCAITTAVGGGAGAAVPGAALSGPGARAISIPYPVVEGESFSVRVGWQLPPGVGSSTLHVELKDARSQPVQFHLLPVGTLGEATVRFTAPLLSNTPSVQLAVWMGADWRTPVAPIWFSHQIWLESRGDSLTARKRRASWMADAHRLFSAGSSGRGPLAAALLDDASLSAAGHREAATAGAALHAAGFRVIRLNASEVANPYILDRSRIRLLVLTDAGRLPADMGPALEGFLHEGGDVALLGAPAWRDAMERVSLSKDVARLLHRVPGPNWIDTADYDSAAGRVPAQRLLSAFKTGSLEGWRQNINPGAVPAEYALESREGRPVLHAVTPDLTGWSTYSSPPLTMPFGPGQTLTCFQARGDRRTPRLSIEWAEKDGSRWIATVPLTTQWQRYSLEPSAFHFWPSTAGRGGRNDSLHPVNASRITMGLAFSHTGQTSGRHEWWVSDVGVAKNPLGSVERPAAPAIPPADGLFPGYRFFPAHDVDHIEPASLTGSAPGVPMAARGVAVYSLQPRATGDGFDRGRPWRFDPLLVARSAQGAWRGIPAALILHTDDEYRGGAWLSVAIRDPSFYESAAVKTFLAGQFRSMRNGVYLQEAGSNFTTYFPGQPVTLGARIVNLGQSAAAATLRITLHGRGARDAALSERAWTLRLEPGESVTRSFVWQPPTALEASAGPDGVLGDTVTTLRAGSFEDRVSNEVAVWKPAADPHWITVSDGQFWLDGHPWKVHGVNYMPSSGIGQDDPALFEQWLSAEAYDPAITQRDLEHIKALGLNAISVFQYHEEVPSQNLLDLLRRCRNLGLHADVSLRPGEPLHFLWPEIRDIIHTYRLAENDTVFAYDLAWEPSLGDQQARTEWDPLWRSWIDDRYGSLAAAEKEWAFPAPVAGGVVTNPPTEQLYQDGPWKKMALAYRRFADELVARNYEQARRLVRSADSHHAVSFRMTETSDPTDDWAGTLSFDFAGVAPAVDFLAPEGYGRIGGWEQVKAGWFERAYGRWAAPDKPMDWKEVGNTVWDADRMADDPLKLKDQAAFFDAFYRMMELSGSSGLFYWWYPGGFRVGENSDFGIINPDGTDRPASAVIRAHARSFLAAPMPPPPDAWITFDPNREATGIYGIYRDTQKEFWDLVAAGKQPGLRTAGTGTTSANCPAVAVGGGPWTGANPPQYLDGLIYGPGTLVNGPGSAFVLNIGDATWLHGTAPDETGTVWLIEKMPDGTEHALPIPEDVAHNESASIVLPAGTPSQLYLEVAGRGRISQVWHETESAAAGEPR